MAEHFERFRRFEYKQNSNLVLQRDGPGPNQNEPTGEPESLAGRVKYKMGDKVAGDGKTVVQDKLEKKRVLDSSKHQTSQKLTRKRAKLDIRKGASVLDDDVTETASYKPTTRETRIIYEVLLKTLQQHLGDQPQEVLVGAAYDILETCRSDKLKDKEKKEECEHILGALSDDLFSKVFLSCKQLTDFTTTEMEEPQSFNQGIEDNVGVAVVFDEEEEDEGDDFGYEEEEDLYDDEEDNILVDDDAQRQVLATKHIEQDEEDMAEKDKYNLNVSEIDPHWLQRKLGGVFSDPNTAVATEKHILSILPIPDVQECENQLVYVLKYENFDIAKLLLKNRWKIWFCTRLGQAQTNEEKDSIFSEMENTPEGEDVLEQLKAIHLRRNKEKELVRNVRKEAASLAEKAGKEFDRWKEEEDAEETTILTGKEMDIEQHKEQKVSSHILDLDSLVFQSGSHFMANTKVKLPDNSTRTEFKATDSEGKNYDEITIPALKRPSTHDAEWTPISELPEWAHTAFTSAKVTKLNPIQSKILPMAFKHFEENLLVCAPTGSGKTNVSVLAMLNLIDQYKYEDEGKTKIDLHAFKIIYVSPMKALVMEQVQSLTLRLESYGITVRELTGDINLTRQQIDETQVIVTTPEKWDIVTRKAGERTHINNVKLIIIDEIHLLHDDRGPVLESIVARTVRHMETTAQRIRLVGLSATLPNYEDVAVFLRVNADKGLFYFGNHYRPVPLLQTYIGIKDKKAIKRYNSLNEITYEKVLQSAGKHQILIFVHSRKETVKTGRYIRDTALKKDELLKFMGVDREATTHILESEVPNLHTNDNKDLLPYGFATHHAGLPRTERKLIEDLFADGHIKVLVSTATLAWGVNLPAHTVIVKGTQVYMPEKGCWCELSPLDVTQMVGRAGRPLYDQSGHGIIITNHSELQYYVSLNNQQLPIESQMISMLVDVLNAECVLGSIRTRGDAVEWLGYTYLFVRMLRNPTLYGISEDERETDKLLTQRRIDLVHSAFVILDKHNMAKYDKRTGVIEVTTLGRVASHYYIKHPSIATYNQHLKPTMSDIELLRIFSLSNEFKYMPVREEEKVELHKLVERVPIPVKGSGTMDDPSSKVNVLLQAYISKLRLEGFALMTDMVFIQQSAGRIMRAIFEICLKRGWATLAQRALQFAKMIERRMWASMSPLRQFPTLKEEMLRKLEKKDFPWVRYYDLSSAELSELIRMPKAGKELHKLIHQFPKLDLQAYVQPITRTCLAVELTITPDFQWEPKLHDPAETFIVLVEDVDGENILHYEMFVLKENSIDMDHAMNFTVPITEPVPPNYFIRVISDRWIHSETVIPVSFKNLILPEKNPPHTQLLDLQPLPINALQFPKAEELYNAQFNMFNPVQTQVFSTLYNTNENVLLCTSPGSGTIVCAEFAILRMIQKESIHKCVYIAPNDLISKDRLDDWTLKFGNKMGLNVVELAGEIALDLELLEKGNIIISTADKWDYVSRRWKTREVFQRIRVFIIDEIQMLDSESGPALEVCVGRMRHISANLQIAHKPPKPPIRIVALACSLANAKDVGEWIGAGANGLFNFHPNVRSVPLEISIRSFDLFNRKSRLLCMGRHVYQSIKQYAQDRQTLVFCADRKQARLTAVDIILNAFVENNPNKFLGIPESEMEKHLSVFSDTQMIETLRKGVGVCHEGLTRVQLLCLRKLFRAGVVKVMVVTESMAWGLQMNAQLVVIQDTKKYDGRERRYVDYPITDLLQMLGCAARPLIETSGIVVLLCHSAKKEYYKKFLSQPLPVESHLDQRLADHINAEVNLKTIENKQDAVDWITWTLYYRRLSRNPNFYGLHGVSHQRLSDHISELVETTVEALQQAHCVAVEDDVNLVAVNLGLIASFYYIRYLTIERFNRSLLPTTKRRALLEILSNANEYECVPMRTGESYALTKLSESVGLKSIDEESVKDPNVKTLILFYAHFNRCSITSDLSSDQKIVLDISIRLIQGLVDVISSNGWLEPVLLAMELSQMVVQAMGTNQSPLLQLPHFNQHLIDKAKQYRVSDVFDLINMEDEDRNALLTDLDKTCIQEIAAVCNRYPHITIACEFDTQKEKFAPGDNVTLLVKLERDIQGGTRVHSPYYPKEKEEQWWLVVGEPSVNQLVAIKRLSIKKELASVKLQMAVPESEGTHDFVLFLMSDSYIGCDLEHKFSILVSS